MKTPKLLVADASAVFSAALVTILGGEYEIRVCQDGLQAVTQLENFCPDVLVADLALTGVDGMTLLRAAAARKSRPALLAITRIASSFVQDMLEKIGVDYLMLKPCDVRCLAERIRELSWREPEAELSPQCEDSKEILMRLGLQIGRRGYLYLERIIAMYASDPDRSLTKDLYPTVGRDNRTSALAVERAVRGAIEAAWHNRDEGIWRQYFHTGPQGTVPRPTNRQFIAAVAAALTLQQRKGA